MASPSSPRLIVVSPRSRSDIEEVTEQLIERFQPAHCRLPGALDLEYLAEVELYNAFGFDIGPAKLDASVEAVSIPSERVIFIREDVYEALGRSQGRARFTVAHEIGHLVLHGEVAEPFMSGNAATFYRKKGEIAPYRDPEWQAETFAGALLMPASTVRKLVADGGRSNELLSSVFEVSWAAARVRLEVMDQQGWL